ILADYVDANGFASVVLEPMLAELEIVPVALEASFTTSVKVPEALAASDPIVHVTVPPLPTAGVLQVQPLGGVMRWNVVPDGVVGIVAVTGTVPVVSLGPRLVAVMVWVSAAPSVGVPA